MLEIKKKNYEVSEKIQLTDEQGNILYEFEMQITDKEMEEIKKIIFANAEKKKSKYMNANYEEKEKMERELEQELKENSNRFEEICFKEHRIPFKEKAGNFKYEETLEMLLGFFINWFTEKKLAPVNTTIMSLKNLINNSMKYR